MNENYGTNNIGTIVVELKANMDDRQIIIKSLHLFWSNRLLALN